MFARVGLLNVGPGMWDEMKKVADEANPIYRAQDGFKSVTFFGDEPGGEYGSFSVWETKEAAEAAHEAIGGYLKERMSGMLKEPPSLRIVEVYEPNS